MMATTATATLRHFPNFPHLPTEIRIKIWAQALPIRILPISVRPSHRLSSSDISFHCKEPPPVLLSVCRESRYETLRFYVIVSDTHKPSRWHTRRQSGPDHKFYFNPYLDTIFLDTSDAVQWLRMLRVIEAQSRILSLALSNAHRSPHAFAIEVSAEKGVREMFVVGAFEEFGWVPPLWTLLPRRSRLSGLMGGEAYLEATVECIESWECEEDSMPKVMAVKEEFWRTQGLMVVGRW
jgi:hypothetical protein